jgi:hypothetical protein
MTDKELFEKTEKAFNLNKKNPILEKVYEKGNFKSLLENTSPVKSNYGANTVSAARGLGRGVAKTGGALAKGLGALGRFAREVIPGTRTSRARTAELQKVQAQARAEELKNMQMRQKLASGDDDGEKKTPEMDKYVKFVYDRDRRFAKVYDDVAKGEKLSSKEEEIYDKGIAQADKIREGEDKQEGKGEAQTEIEQKAGENRIKKLGRTAPNITKFLIDPKNEEIKKEFIRYSLQSPALGIPTETEIVKLADSLTKPLQDNQQEIINFKRFVRNEPNLQDDGASLIKLLPASPKKQTKSGTKKKITLNPQTIDIFLKKGADASKRSIEGQKDEMVRQSKEYKVGNTVLGKSGAQFVIKDISNFTGLITLKDMRNKTIYRFANQLGEVVEKGQGQPELDPVLDQVKGGKPKQSEKEKVKAAFKDAEKTKQLVGAENEESFEQIIKKYR